MHTINGCRAVTATVMSHGYIHVGTVIVCDRGGHIIDGNSQRKQKNPEKKKKVIIIGRCFDCADEKGAATEYSNRMPQDSPFITQDANSIGFTSSLGGSCVM